MILRLNVSRLPATPGGPPAIAVITPPDNPQVNASNLKRRLIDAWGLRNPFRVQIDGSSGDRFIGDVGQGRYEEIDRAPAHGLNFGWPYLEGPVTNLTTCDTSSALTAPIAWYDRSAGFPSGAAVIMGPVYPFVLTLPSSSGAAYPFDYGGDAFFSDYYNGFLRRLKRTGSTWAIAPPAAGQPSATDWGWGFEAVSDYCFAGDGAIWYCRQSASVTNPRGGTGSIGRIVYTGTGGGGGPPATSALTVNPPYPVPSAGVVTLGYTLTAPATVRVTIHDARGALVRTVAGEARQQAGAYPLAWDGNDERGRRAPSGLYVVRVRAAGLVRSRRIVLVR